MEICDAVTQYLLFEHIEGFNYTVVWNIFHRNNTQSGSWGSAPQRSVYEEQTD